MTAVAETVQRRGGKGRPCCELLVREECTPAHLTLSKKHACISIASICDFAGTKHLLGSLGGFPKASPTRKTRLVHSRWEGPNVLDLLRDSGVHSCPQKARALASCSGCVASAAGGARASLRLSVRGGAACGLTGAACGGGCRAAPRAPGGRPRQWLGAGGEQEQHEPRAVSPYGLAIKSPQVPKGAGRTAGPACRSAGSRPGAERCPGPMQTVSRGVHGPAQIRDLNSGTFGFVELALDKSSGQQVAIKVQPCAVPCSYLFPCSARRWGAARPRSLRSQASCGGLSGLCVPPPQFIERGEKVSPAVVLRGAASAHAEHAVAACLWQSGAWGGLDALAAGDPTAATGLNPRGARAGHKVCGARDSQSPLPHAPPVRAPQRAGCLLADRRAALRRAAPAAPARPASAPAEARAGSGARCAASCSSRRCSSRRGTWRSRWSLWPAATCSSMSCGRAG